MYKVEIQGQVREIEPCKICGNQPECYEYKIPKENRQMAVIQCCKNADRKSPKGHSILFTQRMSAGKGWIGLIKRWNKLNRKD